MTSYSVLFLSSAEISVLLLQALHRDERFDVVGVICQPDKPAGRDLIVKKPAPKIEAERLGIAVFQPEKLGDADELLEKFSAEPPDFLITFAYGQILNSDWLALPKVEALNVHASLLPKYRGASPIQAAILNGEKKTGLCLMRMVKEMDAGPVFSTIDVLIPKDVTAGFLHDELARVAADWVPDQIANLSDAVDQSIAEVSYCKKLSKDDGFIDFQESARMIRAKFLAYSPWPGLWTTYQGKRLKLVDIALGAETLAPGQLHVEDGKLHVGTIDGSILINQLQLEGKKCLHADIYIIGQPEFASSSLPS